MTALYAFLTMLLLACSTTKTTTDNAATAVTPVTADSAVTAVTAVTFKPVALDVVRDSTGFVQAMIEFYSLSGDSLKLTAIEGSCRCATASVQRPLAHDSIPGKFFVQINAQHFTDPVNYVDFALTTSPATQTVFRAVIRLPH